MSLIKGSLCGALILVSALAMGSPAMAETRAEASVHARIFYDDLAPYGRWVNHRIYGVVWVPGVTAQSWHPYTYGRWVWTADYGWYWDSDENFGWATYHYGRWAWTAEYGWVWVPDDVWGPAWVEWRYGGGNVGWAPMPPHSRWQNGTVVYARAAVNAPGPNDDTSWVFVAEDDFARGEIRTRLKPRADNRAMLAASVRSTNYRSANGQVFNGGIDVKKLAAATNIKIAAVPTKISSSRAAGASARAANSVTIYRPRLKANVDFSLPAPETEALPWAADTGATVGPNTDATAPASGAVRGETATSIGTSLERDPLRDLGGAAGVGGSIGGGVGGAIGGGGGLRIGR